MPSTAQISYADPIATSESGTVLLTERLSELKHRLISVQTRLRDINERVLGNPTPHEDEGKDSAEKYCGTLHQINRQLDEIVNLTLRINDEIDALQTL